MDTDRWVEPIEVEKITGKKLQTLANERYRGDGIPYYKVGASVRYKLADVLSFMERHRIDPAARREG
ncbi:MAG: DNA-binding protein [Desulfobaccales bacterium]